MGPYQETRKKAERLRKKLKEMAEKYPGVWPAMDKIRESKGKHLPDWPDWCYLPIAASQAIVSQGGRLPIDLEVTNSSSILAAFAAWRPTQGVYRFDAEMFDALISTPIKGKLPTELFFHLPEWCVYVDLPRAHSGEDRVYGFFAHLEYDVNEKRNELRMLIDSEIGFYSMILHLGNYSLKDSVEKYLETAIKNSKGLLDRNGIGNLTKRIKTEIEPMVSLLLYLCSQNAEIGDGTKKPTKPTPKKTKRGLRFFPPHQVQQWDVGVRIGSALRQAGITKEDEHPQKTNNGRLPPKPHVRRAHWHTYRVGPGRKEARLKWIPPIAVNLENADGLPVTIHPVKR